MDCMHSHSISYTLLQIHKCVQGFTLSLILHLHPPSSILHHPYAAAAAATVSSSSSSPLLLLLLQVWFQNRRAKYRKQEKQLQKALTASPASVLPCNGAMMRNIYQSSSQITRGYNYPTPGGHMNAPGHTRYGQPASAYPHPYSTPAEADVDWYNKGFSALRMNPNPAVSHHTNTASTSNSPPSTSSASSLISAASAAASHNNLPHPSIAHMYHT